MRSWTFSLTSLLAIVTLLSIDLGAAASDSHFMASLAYTLFLGLLCFSVAAAFVAGADARAFWLGFAVFGLVYWLGCFQSTPSPQATSFAGGLTRWNASSTGSQGATSNYFITDVLIDLTEEYIAPRYAVGSHVYARWQGSGYYWGTVLETDTGRYLIQWDDGSTPTWQTNADMTGASTSRRIALHTGVATLWAIFGGAIVAIWAGRRKVAPESSSRVPGGSG